MLAQSDFSWSEALAIIRKILWTWKLSTFQLVELTTEVANWISKATRSEMVATSIWGDTFDTLKSRRISHLDVLHEVLHVYENSADFPIDSPEFLALYKQVISIDSLYLKDEVKLKKTSGHDVFDRFDIDWKEDFYWEEQLNFLNWELWKRLEDLRDRLESKIFAEFERANKDVMIWDFRLSRWIGRIDRWISSNINNKFQISKKREAKDFETAADIWKYAWNSTVQEAMWSSSIYKGQVRRNVFVKITELYATYKNDLLKSDEEE
jgi:hypothetical protein